jgi:hypothetical protein
MLRNKKHVSMKKKVCSFMLLSKKYEKDILTVFKINNHSDAVESERDAFEWLKSTTSLCR